MKNNLTKPLALVGAVALLSMAVTGSAHADNRFHGDPRSHDRGWDAHARGARDWHRHHPYVEPGVVYAPPAVVYAPPPQPEGINLIIPFNIR